MLQNALKTNQVSSPSSKKWQMRPSHSISLTVEDVSSEICRLDSKKSSTGVSIGLLQDNVDICAPRLTY